MMSRPRTVTTVRVSVSESLTESDGATGRTAAALAAVTLVLVWKAVPQWHCGSLPGQAGPATAASATERH